MSKLYVFGIGGTGSRVIRSLTYLLASGIDLNVSTIVPIIIDPDAANGDVNRTIELLKKYQEIRNEINQVDDNSFFSKEIRHISQNFKLNIQHSNRKFKEYIDYSSLDESNKALVSMLFSEQNLDAQMEVGFKGNPNIGSVVLNQFQQSDDFKTFASSFQQGDKIFIISSIFGGTGASGFPLLLKNIRSANQNLPNFALLQSARIGAISVLPYFGIKPNDDSAIDKSTFISKTKAALSYYEHGVTNGSLDTMYYIGDNRNKDYDNHEGSFSQKNDAHFIELASALAIIDFVNDNSISTNVVKEFGMENDTDSITFKDLSTQTRSILSAPLSQYFYFDLFLKNHLTNSFEADFARKEPVINQEFLRKPFYQNLSSFNEEFQNWLREMKDNNRSFVPFELSPSINEIFKYVNHIEPKKESFSLFPVKNYDKFIAELNKANRELTATEINQKFISLFYNGTKSLIQEKFNF
jgi:hypothetical protein